MNEEQGIKINDNIVIWWAWGCHTTGQVIHIPTGPGDWWHIITDEHDTIAINPNSKNVDTIYKLNPRPELARHIMQDRFSAACREEW